jgi:hypothetical protein
MVNPALNGATLVAPFSRAAANRQPHCKIISFRSSVVVSPSVMMPSASAPSVMMAMPAHVTVTMTMDLNDPAVGIT